MKKKKVVPKCCICGDPGNLFCFVGKDKAFVYCDALCELEHKARPDYPVLDNELIIRDDKLWLKLVWPISLCAALLGLFVLCL